MSEQRELVVSDFNDTGTGWPSLTNEKAGNFQSGAIAFALSQPLRFGASCYRYIVSSEAVGFGYDGHSE